MLKLNEGCKKERKKNKFIWQSIATRFKMKFIIDQIILELVT